MLKKLSGVLDHARRALGAEQALIRDGLGGLKLIDKALAARAVDFVASGGDPSVLLELAAYHGEAGIPLGRPGGIGWRNYSHGAANTAAAKASLAARDALYRLVLNDDEHVTMLVRLGKVLEAADQKQQLDYTGTFAPDWLQYLINDALSGSHARTENYLNTQERPAWDVNLLTALLADGGHAPTLVLPIIFDRRDIGNRLHTCALHRLQTSGALDDYMLAHAAEVEAAADLLPADGRNILIKRIGDNAQLVDAFSALLVRLAVCDNKTVRATAARLIDSINKEKANAALAELLGSGQTKARLQAIELLARTQGEGAIPVLAAALPLETSKQLQQAMQSAIAQLQAVAGARAVQLPEPPPLPPEPREVLGDEAFDVLLKNRAELLERLRKNADAEIESNRTAKHKYKYQQDSYTRYSRLQENHLRLAIKALNGDPAMPKKSVLADPEMERTLALAGRVQARADFGMLQMLRWCIAQGRHWGFWPHPGFQSWLARQDLNNVDLRQLAAMISQCGDDPATLYRYCLRDHYTPGLTPQHVLPAERVWPLFAEHPELIDQGLGMAPTASEGYVVPQLGGTLSVLATFPVIPARWMPRLMELALGEGKTHRAAAQQVLSRTPHIGRLVCDALGSSKQEVRIEAVRWLAAMDYRAGVPELRAALDKESRETAGAAMMTALEQLGEDISPWLAPATLLAQARKGLKGKPPASMSWLNLGAAPSCTWQDGAPVEAEIIRWWVILACKLKEPGGNALLERYLHLLAPTARASLGNWLLQMFIARDTQYPSLEEGMAYAQIHAPQRYQQYQDWAKQYPDHYAAQGKLTLAQVFDDVKRDRMGQYLGSAINDKGLLALVSGVPGHALVSAIQHYMRDHYQRRAQVEALLEAACVSNEASVIQFVLGIARRYRTASVQEKARVLVQRIAERNGWTQDQLGDRTVPTGGLDDSGRLLVQYGSRQYSVTLDAALKPVLRNSDGKTVSALPAPREDDAPESVKEAKQQLTACKKEIKQVIEMQTSRLYDAMCATRLWPVAEWHSYLRQHPLVGRLVQQLVWQEVDAAGNAVRLFRPTEDGSLIDASDDEVTLDEHSGVRLAHCALLDEAEASAWLAHFNDYKIQPLFAQMTRQLPQQRASETIDDRLGWASDTFTLRGAFSKLGYQRAAAEDGGVFHEYHKQFLGAGMMVVIEFSGNALPEENLPAALKTLSFRSLNARRYTESALTLEQIPPVLLAEAYGDYLAVAAACSGYDPGWEKKMPW